jgi:hypothetical protein
LATSKDIRILLVSGEHDGRVPPIARGDAYLFSVDDGAGGLQTIWKPREISGTAQVGATGATGTSGAVGAVGATGATGGTGATGATSASSGAAGATGTSGAVGGTGATGATGGTGATGATSASSGAAGATGTRGAVGAIGATGATGGTGAVGATGATGSNSGLSYTWACDTESLASVVTDTFIIHVQTNAPVTTEGVSFVVAPVAQTLTGIRIFINNAFATAGITLTLRNNQVDTALAVTLAAGATVGSLTGQSVSIAAGDKLSVKYHQTAVENNTTMGLRVVVF